MSHIVIVVFGSYLGVLLLIFVNQRSMMYHPHHDIQTPEAYGVPEMTVVETRTEDGFRLSSWYAPAREGFPTILYFHGNTGHIGGRAFKAREMIDAGFGVFLASYRGFGGNPGKPTEQGLYKDARGASDFLQERGVSPTQIVVYGESLGTGVATHLAFELAQSDNPVRALVLEAPYTSMADVSEFHYPYLFAQYLVKDRYNSISKIASIETKFLIIHGEKDQTVPIEFGKRLFEAAVMPKRSHWIAGGSHGNLYDQGAADLVFDFLLE